MVAFEIGGTFGLSIAGVEVDAMGASEGGFFADAMGISEGGFFADAMDVSAGTREGGWFVRWVGAGGLLRSEREFETTRISTTPITTATASKTNRPAATKREEVRLGISACLEEEACLGISACLEEKACPDISACLEEEAYLDVSGCLEGNGSLAGVVVASETRLFGECA